MPGTDRFWSQPEELLLKDLSADRNGLSQAEAERRMGASLDKIQDTHAYSGFGLFVRQFKSPITILLIVSAVLSFSLGERPDAMIILFILLVSALLGFYQERGARNALQRLLQLVQVKTTVLRDGKLCSIPLASAVSGDIVSLAAGNTVPGDCRLLASRDLFTNEASLTGETFPVEKKCCALSDNTPLSARSNALFLGTSIVSGTATALVVHTGKQTEFGKISARLRHLQPETEFERGIRRFGYLLLEVTLILVLVIFCINALASKPILDSFLFSLAIAVGLTPQLLPAIISINLARGSMQMAKRSVIVKKLSAIENFGSMDVLCSDKTGTITEGIIIVEKTLDVEDKENEMVYRLAWLNAFFENGYSNPIDKALLTGRSYSVESITKQDEVPYDFTRKRLSILVKGSFEDFLSTVSPDIADSLLITKGAFDKVVEVCSHAGLPGEPLSPIEAVKPMLKSQYKMYSDQGYRILGLAWLPGNRVKGVLSRESENAMYWGGMLLLTDPPKTDIQDTIGELNTLGISLKIITGDNELVARHVASTIGLGQPKVLTGGQLNTMSLDALARIAPDISVFAAVEPNQKEKILLALKKAGHVVGYMGDGINDAPALHAADVGISVNNAADVARQAADIVLMQGDLRVLAAGVREGRKTFMNTLKYVFMATSANFGNMFSMAGSSIFLPFLPLLPKQVLLTNLLTDIPEMTIATDHVDESTIQYPRRIDLQFIRRFMVIFGLISSIFDFATFWVLLKILHASPVQFRTGWFVESVVTATLVILVVRTSLPFLRSRPSRYLLLTTFSIIIVTLALSYSPLAVPLGFSPLPLSFYPWLALIFILYLSTAEITKYFFYHWHRVKHK